MPPIEWFVAKSGLAKPLPGLGEAEQILLQ